MFLRFNIAFVLLVVCLATPAWSDYKAGEDAYHRGDYATAVREWSPLAKLGIAAGTVPPRPAVCQRPRCPPGLCSSAAMV